MFARIQWVKQRHFNKLNHYILQHWKLVKCRCSKGPPLASWPVNSGDWLTDKWSPKFAAGRAGQGRSISCRMEIRTCAINKTGNPHITIVMSGPILTTLSLQRICWLPPQDRQIWLHLTLSCGVTWRMRCAAQSQQHFNSSVRKLNGLAQPS
jgi:hypothetical protein